MTNTVLIKRSGTANSVPLAGNLQAGELAINYTDGNLFYKNAANVVTVIASNQFVSVAGNVTGGNLNATGSVYGVELWSTNSVGSEGGQLNLSLPASGSTLNGGVVIDVYNNQLRFYERSGTNRGAYIDLTAASAGVGSNLLAGGGSTPTQIVNGTSNVVVASSGNITVGVAGTAAVATFTTVGIVANSVSATNNGVGTNFKVGDDAWIGDINLADTISIRGQQNAANGYIVFGNADGTQLGRAGSGPLTYGGAFSATGNITGGNIISVAAVSGVSVVATGNITGGNLLTAGLISTSANISGNNIQAGNVLANGTMSSTGAVTAGTFATAGLITATGNVTGGNILTSGIISATGNITGGNLNAAGLSLSGNVVSALNSTSNITTTANISGGNIVTSGPTGNITGANVISATTLSATANVTGNYFIGNGSQLTGISTSTTRIFNGTSEANIGTSGGNANITIGGTSNVAVFTTTGLNVTGTISANGNIDGGNLRTAGLISASGNVTGGNIISTAALSGVSLIVDGTVSFNSSIDTITIAANQTSGLIRIGGSSGTGIITLGQSTTNQTVDIANGAVVSGNVKTVNIGGNGVANSVSNVNIFNSVAGNAFLYVGGSGGTAHTGNSTAAFLANTIVSIANTSGSALSVAGNITGGNVLTAQVITSSLPLVLADVSNQCDGAKAVFPMLNDQANITSANITDSKNLEVVVSGLRLSPYVRQLTYPWLTPYDSYPGYRVVASASSANVIIYNPPAIGSQVTLTIINNSSVAQTRKYPYSATTIALGD